MGWLAASTGTLVAAYAVYSLTARFLAYKTGALQKAPTWSAQTTATEDGFIKTSEKSLRSTPREALPPAAVSKPSPPPPSFEVSSPVVAGAESLKPSSSARKPPSSTTMAPPPPPPPLIRSSSPPRLKPPTMAAPPRPGNVIVRPPPSAAASLRVPQTKVLSQTHMQPASSTLGIPKKGSKQITLKPGYSPLDWAALTSNPNSCLRGKDAPDHMVRVTPSQLKKQTGRKGKDAWTVYHGKVYNITPYLPFHPGGEAEIMKGAGRDSANLFMEVHPWVNWDGMLAECLVGILVAENDDEATKMNELDEMD